jgi:hypothetical protein
MQTANGLRGSNPAKGKIPKRTVVSPHSIEMNSKSLKTPTDSQKPCEREGTAKQR